ncbi:hypothetical protein C7451_10427 [Blastomonas natatoria]|uniref:Metallo-beta-lactamase domain-containing protein n=1 Tax=Blastomonas natatoria TaxID=34015 RepID=A0A2V3V8N9_9SPHN|nr:hypothetical protein [Blastomonas natatoria]PXW77534.1 hypothetical protein C7451_10427 [Blastomonas natatoria]
MRQLHQDYWNFRGSFKIARIVDIGTHMSLVRRGNGRFLALDSYELDDDDRARLLELTDNGRLVDAILNVHPFHTLHCPALADTLPGVRLIGTRRHLAQLPGLNWDERVIEDASTQAEFADDLSFSIPAGVDFISDDEKVHVASVLVRHRASGIVHVDDTINVLAPPELLSAILPEQKLRFHPMLAKALEQRSGAADDYARWAESLSREWSDTPFVCAAHSTVRELPPGGWQAEILAALDDVESTLAKHRAAHG